MNRKLVLALALTLLVGMLSMAFDVQKAKASGTVYIRADGSIDPPDAPISTFDNVTYTLTGNITSDADGIVVGRDNIVIDGAGYTLQGTGAYDSNGIDLTGRSNATIKNTRIAGFYYGIVLDSSSGNSIYGNVFVGDGLVVWSSYNNVVEDNLANGKPLAYLEDTSNLVVEDAGQVILVNCNNITVSNLNLSHTTVGVQLCQSNNSTITDNNISNNVFGVGLYSSSSGNNISRNNIRANNHSGIDLGSSFGNNISGNNITANGWDGIDLNWSSNNGINGNNITNSWYGIRLENGEDNGSISGNNIANNDIGVGLDSSSNNNIFGNNITNNEEGILLTQSPNNKIYHNNFINNPYHQASADDWINVWDDGYPSGGNYWSNYSGTDANHDGIGDTPYIIEANNTDNYPLMNQIVIPEFPLFFILPLFMMVTLLAAMVYTRKNRISDVT